MKEREGLEEVVPSFLPSPCMEEHSRMAKGYVLEPTMVPLDMESFLVPSNGEQSQGYILEVGEEPVSSYPPPSWNDWFHIWVSKLGITH